MEGTVAGFTYPTPPILVLAFWGTPVFWPLVAAELTVWAISMLHAFLIRDQYRAAMLGGAAAGLPAPPDGRFDLHELALPKGIDSDVARALEEAQAAIEELATTGRRITDPDVRASVDALARTAQRILFELRDEPRRLELARGFLTYYLGAAQRIVSGYVDLSGRGLPSAEASDVLARAVTTIDTLQRAFDRELVTLALTDVIDLDAEISLLETTTRSESV
jgi:5-bromo-4-chloroindolyl phosphate hydrolysis protein